MLTEEQRKHNEEVKHKIAALIDVQQRLCFRDLGFCHGAFRDLYISCNIEEKFKKFFESLTTDIIVELSEKLYTERTQQ